MKRTKIPTLLGILFLVIGVAAGVLLVRNRQTFRLGAEAGSAPKNVRITNITDSSFAVSWVTDAEVAGFIKYGEGSALNKTELDEVENSTSHYVTVQGLKPQTTYSLKINSGGVDYDQQGSPWQVTTGSQISAPESNIVSGTVVSPTGAPVGNALVYISVGGSSPLSTLTSSKGVWLLNIGLARNSALSSYTQIDPANTLLEISVQTGNLGVASAQIYPQSANPVPQITIGQTHDFKNLPPSENSGIPVAELDLPEGSTPSSGFEVDENSTPKTSVSVTLESIDEGEIISTQEPEFFGEGPVGTEITITVESDPITDKLTVGSGGSWNWSPPEGLPEGPHTITISWRDTSGILRTLKRTFVVQAAEGPAFESTPSASTTPTPSPSPSPSATPKATQSPTPAATATPTATPEELIDAGSLTPTYLLSIMGLTLLLFGGVVGYLAFKE